MTNFNYQKAWFVFAKPAFNNLNTKQKEVHSKVSSLIGELNQGRDLNIPLTPAITDLLESLTCLELAQLARTSYFVGHWKPGNVDALLDNKRGESWKITNAIDQILRKRLFNGNTKVHRVEIHEGCFRVSYLSHDCWLWEEVGLATEINLEIINKIGLNYSETTFQEQANKIKATIGDLWDTDSINSLPSNKDYEDFLKREIEKSIEREKQACAAEIEELRQKPEQVKYESNCKIEVLEKGLSTSNLIYYTHTKEWALGWKEPVTQEESEVWRSADLSFDVKIKLSNGTSR